MRRGFIGIAALALAASALANTKVQDKLPISFGFRAGGVLAQDSELQHTSNGWFGIGGDVFLGRGLLPTADTHVSIDWFGHDGDNVLLFNLNQRFYGAQTPSGQRVYLLAGVGGAKFDIEDGDDDTVFGGRIGVGLEFTKNLYGEVSLFLSGKTKDAGFRTNSLGFYVGWRL